MAVECAYSCPVCGQELAPLTGRPSPTCPNRWCRRSSREFSVAFVVGLHQGALRGAITRYKYRGERDLAAAFAATVAAYLAAHPTWFEEFDLITAVPSYTGPGARRSWDPLGDILAALAERLARCGGGWQVARDAVRKCSETPGMAGLGWGQRQALAAGALRDSLFVPDPGQVDGSQVLVIDDVLTEGSTLQEVARALRAAGASEVAGLVLARPPWSPVPPGETPAAVVAANRESRVAGRCSTAM